MNDLLCISDAITSGFMQVLGYLVALADPGHCYFSSDDNQVHHRFTHRPFRMGLAVSRAYIGDGYCAHGGGFDRKLIPGDKGD